MKRFHWFVLAIGLVVVGSWSISAQAEKITWKMASAWPAGTQIQWAPEYFAEEVNKMSGGRLEIKSYAAGKLVGAFEAFDAANMGTIDVAHASPAYLIGKKQAACLFAYMPFGMEAFPLLTWLYEGEGAALYQELYASFQFGYAAPCGIVAHDILAWSNKPIKSIEDFKGLKFRTSGYWGDILTGAGASVVNLPAGQIYEALQRNVLDGGEFSIPSMDKTLAFNEVAKYLLVPGIHQASTMLDIVVNKKSWEKLSPDLQEIVKGAAQATTMRMLTNSTLKDIDAMAFFKEKGVQIQYLDPAVQKELHARTLKLLDQKAANDPFFKKILDSQNKFRKSYNEYKALMTPQYE